MSMYKGREELANLHGSQSGDAHPTCQSVLIVMDWNRDIIPNIELMKTEDYEMMLF